jgi:diguanylate cyclase
MTHNDPGYTHRVAEAALERIRALSLSADPAHYEIWYAYVAGQKPGLNQAINDTLAKDERLTDIQLEQIYEEHFCPSHTQAGISRIGGKVSDTIENAIQMLDELILSTTRSRSQFSEASTKLETASDQKTIRAIANVIIRELRDVEVRYSALENRFVESRRNLDELQNALSIATVEAARDSLTGLLNRRQFDRLIEQAIGKAGVANPLSVLMVDIDRFKKFNDEFGHPTGDSVLRLVASAMTQSVRDTDLVARYGGEEFAIILPNTTLTHAVKIGERIRTSVMSRKLKRRSTGEVLGVVTVSTGAATYHGGESSRELTERADECLYLAKSTGRNRTCSERDLVQSQDGTSKPKNEAA